jgi:hypothetical protein
MKMTCSGVEGRFSDLVGFVEDVDFVAVTGRGVSSGVAQFANFVDAAVGGRIDLNYICGVALANLDAGVAHAAGLRCGPGWGADFSAAVQRLGHDAGDGGFTDAAMPGEDVAVRDAVLGERIHQGMSDVVLASNVGKTLRTIFSG